MLRVTVELLPKGDESRASTLGVLTIANDLTGDGVFGNYSVYLDGKPKDEIVGHFRPDGSWALVRKALEVMGK